MVTFDKLQTVITAGAALTDDTGIYNALTFPEIRPCESLRKRRNPSASIVMEIDQEMVNSRTGLSIESPRTLLSLESQIRQMGCSGKSLRYLLRPASMSDGEMVMKVVDSEVLDNGEEAWWVLSNFNDVQTRSLIGSNGDILRQEGALGISMVRMSPEDAQQLDLEEPVDLIGLSGVPVKGKRRTQEKNALVVA